MPLSKTKLYSLRADTYIRIPFHAVKLSLHQLREFCVNLVK